MKSDFQMGRLKERHNVMLKAQKNSGGFSLTIRELMKLWNVKSTNTVRYFLDQMVELGWVERHYPDGSKHSKYLAREIGA